MTQLLRLFLTQLPNPECSWTDTRVQLAQQSVFLLTQLPKRSWLNQKFRVYYILDDAETILLNPESKIDFSDFAKVEMTYYTNAQFPSSWFSRDHATKNIRRLFQVLSVNESHQMNHKLLL